MGTVLDRVGKQIGMIGYLDASKDGLVASESA